MTKNYSNTIYCYYFDYLESNTLDVAELYKGLRNKTFCSNNNNLYKIIYTCQRIEVYSLLEKIPIGLEHIPFRKTTSTESSLLRLVSVCTGLKSLILYEENIFYQVDKFYKEILETSPLNDFFKRSLSLAKEIRYNYKLNSPTTYEKVAVSFIENKTNERNLVIIGSGMLARNILKFINTNRYNSITYLTRTKRNLKKKFKHIKGIRICTIEEFLDFQHTSFSVIIATNVDNFDYENRIQKVAENKECHLLFDLSAIPISFEEHEHIISENMYGDYFMNIVKETHGNKEIDVIDIKNHILRLN